MNKQPYRKFEKVEHQDPQRKIKLEVYDDGQYVGTITTEYIWNQENQVDEETLTDYVCKKFPTRKRKYLTIKIV